MRLAGALVFALVVACASPVRADDPAPTPTPQVQVEGGGTWQSLSNNYGNWHSLYAEGEFKQGRRSYYGTITSFSRNAVTDPQYLVGTYIPTAQTNINLEANFSPTHQFEPANEFIGSLDHRLASGWGYFLAYDYRSYTSLDAGVGTLGVDRYFGHYHAAYGFQLVGLSNVDGLAVNQKFTFARYYGLDDQNSAGITLAIGQDIENVGLANPAIYHTVEIDLAGRHWFAPHLGITWDLFTVRQGQLYTRTGFQLGLRNRS